MKRLKKDRREKLKIYGRCGKCPFRTPNSECRIGTIEHCALEYIDKDKPRLTEKQNEEVIEFLTSPEFIKWFLEN